MSDAEKVAVRAMLTAARFPARDIEWMTQSCPSMERCKEVCLQRRYSKP